MENLENEIRKLVSIGQTEKALSIILDSINNDEKNEVIVLTNRFTEIKKSKRLGIISFQDETIELNKINNSILEIATNLKQSEKHTNTIISQNWIEKINRPKSNYAQMILALCAIITLIITTISVCSKSASNTQINHPKEELKNTSNSPIKLPVERDIIESQPKLLEIDVENCVKELFEEDFLASWSCIQGLINNKEFDRAASILEIAKERTINKIKLKKFNSRLNDLDIIKKLRVDDAWGEFNDSLVVIMKKEKEGLTDKKGEIIFNTIFESVNPQDFQPIVEVKENGKIGFLMNSGKVIHSPRFSFANPQEYHPLISIHENKKVGFMDSLGNILYEPQFQEAMYASEGLIGVKKKDKWGFINVNGKIVIDFKYNTVDYFRKGKTKVRINDKEFEIDKKGNKIK